jgi:rod shape-determining protein MreC
MSNLFAFIARYYRFMLFLFLEFISLLMVVNYNRFQGAGFYGLTYEFTGGIYSMYNDVNTYFSLREVNDSLMAENARLRAASNASKYADTAKNHTVVDTFYKEKYTYIPANVINNYTYQRNNYLTIDVGTNHGVEKGGGQGVITTSGVIGITKDISTHYTGVLSLLHKEFSVKGEIVETGSIGEVRWEGTDPNEAVFKLPADAKIQKGKLYHVITSKYSQVFPYGIPVGEFTNFVAGTDNQYTAFVKLSANLQNVKQVYVVKNIMQAEQKQVEKKESN